MPVWHVRVYRRANATLAVQRYLEMISEEIVHGDVDISRDKTG